MSESTTESGTAPAEPVQAAEPQEGQEGEQKTFTAEYVDKLRKENAKYRTEAKANAGAAKQLAEIEESQKTEAQKAADREAAAEKRAVDAEARALRREVALEHTLSKDDAALLDSLTDEDAMRALAARLSAGAGKKSNYVPREGTNPNPAATGTGEREFVRELFGTGG